MEFTVNIRDKYNFNPGQYDIASGAPDDENGRFEALGWAKSFYSVGSATRIVTWKAGNITSSTKIVYCDKNNNAYKNTSSTKGER